MLTDEERKHRRAYQQQRNSAYCRGVEWLFTYETWRAWWGDDIAQRGAGRFDLCMSRKLDAGPYEPGNVVKATNRQNAKTAGAMQAKRRAEEAARVREANLNAAMWQESAPPADESTNTLGYIGVAGNRTSADRRYRFSG